MRKLVVVSNRLPAAEAKPGGLAVALQDALRRRDCLWAGWSGEIADEAGVATKPAARIEGGTRYLAAALTPEEHDKYYLRAANSVLWPTFHYRVDLARHQPDDAVVYRAVNARFARLIAPHVQNALIWAHDYHLMMLAEELRALGVKAPAGFFLHIPFPAPEVFATIPWSRALAHALAAYDVVGFQTDQDCDNFHRFMAGEFGTRLFRDGLLVGGRMVRTGAFPISIDPRQFAERAQSPAAQRAAELLSVRAERALVIGVDRMDYSKGIPERLCAIEKFLADSPDMRGRVQFIQIAPPSRESIEAYADLHAEVDRLIGRINGANAMLDWTPVRYLAQNVERDELAGIFRLARAALVTPLRDGMNLVAKEYVAAQDPADPGVLILSRFAGAAAEMPAALIVNPHDIEETARTLAAALAMPLDERKARHQELLKGLLQGDAARWSGRFLDAVAAAGAARAPLKPAAIA